MSEMDLGTAAAHRLLDAFLVDNQELELLNARLSAFSLFSFLRIERVEIRPVMQKGTSYDREDVIRAVARHLGFSRVTDAVRNQVESAINSAIRQGVVSYDRDMIWREH